MVMALESPARIGDDFSALAALVRAPVSSADDLHARLARIQATLSGVDLARYDVAATRVGAPDLLRMIFTLYIALRGRVAEWRLEGLMSREVQKALRDLMATCRYAGDILGELHLGHPGRTEGETEQRSAFTGSPLDTQVNPAFATGNVLTFQDGDVILMRGVRHNSAAIARIGDIDSQFSHLAIVHVDAAGKPWVVEALIEDGAIVNPLEVSLAHGIGRAILFRYRDPQVAAAAAKFIHDRVTRSRRNVLLRIHYDFSMRMEGYRRLFCSKLVRQAFEAGSGGRIKLPTYGTRLDMRNRDFFRRIGVKAVETFAPGDIELEPDFDVVAEWRDFKATSDLRLQDVLMDKLFEWMDSHGYRFRETFVIRLIGLFGKLASYLSDDAKTMLADVIPKIPINMKRRTIGTIAMLHKTAEPLFEELKRLEADSIARTGRQLHPREVRDILEGVRQRIGHEIGYLVAKA
jgi:hypothetical protein